MRFSVAHTHMHARVCSVCAHHEFGHVWGTHDLLLPCCGVCVWGSECLNIRAHPHLAIVLALIAIMSEFLNFSAERRMVKTKHEKTK